MSLIIWLALRDSVSIRRYWVFVIIPVLILVAGGLQLLVGYLMDRWKMIHYYQRWDTERNPVISDILKEVKKHD